MLDFNDKRVQQAMQQCPSCQRVFAVGIEACRFDGASLVPLEGDTEGLEPLDRDAPEAAGEYRILAKLGEGGAGTVYLGEHTVIGRLVAIKVIDARPGDDERRLERFVQEARALNAIRHHHLVEAFAFGKLDDGRHYSVMEYLKGETLQSRLERDGRLSLEDTVAIALPICDALACAHDAGLVHRDLKPDNLFLTKSYGGAVVPKVLDFGVAKLIASDGDGPTRTGEPVGTPLYMAPEQCQALAVDARTDIYAFGVVLYRMLTGRLPFGGETLVEAIAQKLGGRAVDAPSQVVPELPSTLDAIVLSCLAIRPEDRPASMRARAEDLERLVRGAPPIDRRPPPPSSTGRVLRAGGILAASVVTLVLLLRTNGPAPAIPGPQPRAPLASTPPAAPPPRSGRLTIASDQPARISVDGVERTRDAKSLELELSEGPHAVLVVVASGERFETTAQVRPDAGTSVQARFAPAQAATEDPKGKRPRPPRTNPPSAVDDRRPVRVTF